MKRSVILFVTVLLAGCLTALGEEGLARRSGQDSDRPRRVDAPKASFLGVELQEVSRESAQRLKLKAERGAIIENVTPESSAAKAGLKKDDVILKWNGEPVESAGELYRRIRETPAGRTVRLGMIRDGIESETTVTLGERSEYAKRFKVAPAVSVDLARPPREARVRVGERYRMGLSLQDMSPQLAEYFGLGGRNGALVLYVYPDSPAAKAGIKAGDVILSVGGETTENPLKVHEALRTKRDSSVELRVMRDKQEKSFTVQLEKGKTSWLMSPDDLDLTVLPEIAPIPTVLVEPITIPKINVAPMRLKVHPATAPIAIPEISIPQISIPQITLPPLKLVVPYRVRVIV
jgi:membrane-associated protease RseP (regulator of RpoE activity)